MSNRILLKRLQKEYEEIKERFAKTKHVKVIPNHKNPPDEYVVVYDVVGVGKDKKGQMMEVKEHIVSIYLPHNFLEIGPSTTFKTPHFHPNIYPNSSKFCAFAGAYRAGESLSDFIFRLGEVIQYKNYNLHSPANKEATQWAKFNDRLFPLDKKDLHATGFMVFNNAGLLHNKYRKYFS